MSWVEELFQDARYALRSFRANPTFTLVAVITLTAGIGANALIFSIVSGVLLRPLPYGAPDRLVQINQVMPSFGLGALRNIQEYRAGSTLIEEMAGYVPNSRAINSATGPERVGIVLAERSLFRVLDVEAQYGRTFREDDSTEVLVVGAEFARRRFESAEAAVGQRITLEGQTLTIVGVMPESFQFPYYTSRFAGTLASPRIELWSTLEPPRNPRAAIDFTVGRLKSGASLAAARDEMNAIAKRLAERFPETNAGFGVELTPLEETIVGSVRSELWTLLGAVALVLLAACTNVANLLLVRASARTREIAVRTAIGAGRLRLVRQFVTESTMLALLGGVFGFALAKWGTPLLLAISASKIPRAADISVDWRVFTFLLGVSLLTGIVFGLAPGIAACRTDVQGTLKGATGLGGSSALFRRFRDALAVAELALAFVLVIGAVLIVREFLRLRNTDTGLNSSNVLTMHLMPNMSARDCYDLAEKIQALPGVRAAAFSQMLPLQSWGWTASFSVKGRPAASASERPVVELRYITPEYFNALDVPILRGRAFTSADVATAPRVIIVNEALVRRYLSDLEPVGLETDRGQIVGVIRDVRTAGLERPVLPEIYFPMAQNVSQVRDLGMSLIISANVPPVRIAGPAQDVIRRSYPNLAIFGVKTMEEIVADSLSETNLYTWLVGSFAVLALVMASAGIYGVMSYAVVSRTREFGIRLALGENRGSLQFLVLRHAATLAAIGLGIGLFGVLA
ncbi:MAG: ABC transporter permease, partial [Acidobacteria bacterium]|nr:ABC transporter permease [Acidobacteriota bacterium]